MSGEGEVQSSGQSACIRFDDNANTSRDIASTSSPPSIKGAAELSDPANGGSSSVYGYPASSRKGHTHGHAFPDRADSLRDVAALAKLVDYRSNWYEEVRMSEQDIRERTKGLGWSKSAAVAAFYERQNEILDGWREIDEILDSRFPEEVMRRFAVHDEEIKKRQKSLDRKAARIRNGKLDSDSEDDGNASDDEGDEGLQFGNKRSKPLKCSFSAKAVSALSGFWFNTGSPDQRGKRSNSRGGTDRDSDLESGRALGRKGPHYDPKLARRSKERGRLLDLQSTEEEGGNEAEDEHDYPGISESPTPSTPNRQRGRRHSAKPIGNYGATGTASPKTASALFDKIREEGRWQELRRSESNITLPGSLQTRSFTKPKSANSTVKGVEPMNLRQIENNPEHINGHVASSDSNGVIEHPGAPGQEGSLDCKYAKERRSRPYGSHSEERQALLDTVPGKDKEEETNRGVQFAININLAVNILLLGGKGIAVVSSNSVSLIASFVDSALDLLSTIIIFGTSKAIAYRSWRTIYKYPVGKKRLEPLGVVVFSVLMIASFCQVLIESLQRLKLVTATRSQAPDAATELPLIGIAFMLATIGIKTVMWLLYRASKSSGVRAVAQDAENDVVFNIVSLIFPIVGSKLGAPALDPIGGIVLSIYIIYEWIHTLFETITKLSGAVASSEQISKCLYLVTRFNSVRSVSAFELFHSGDDYIAEADVVLPQSIALKEAHDLGEIITYCTESVEGVERAYIHLDYNPKGQSGHIALRG